MRRPKFWWEKRKEEKELLEEAELILEKLKTLDDELAADIIDELRTLLIDEYNAMTFALIPGLELGEGRYRFIVILLIFCTNKLPNPVPCITMLPFAK